VTNRNTDLQPVVDYLEQLTNELASLRKRVVDAEGVSVPNLKFTTGSVVFAGASGYPDQDNAQLFWDNTNNRLGVGTATPGLQVDTKMKGIFPALNVSEKDTTNRRATVGFGVNGETATTGWILGQGLNNSTTKDFYLQDLTAAVTRLYVDTSGRLGINNTAPDLLLDIESASTNFDGIELTNTDTTTRRWAVGANGNGTSFGPSKGFLIRDISGAATRLVIDTSGNVGIGANPSHKLHVTDAAAAGLEMQSSNTTGYSRIRFVSNTRTWGFITEGSAGGTFPGKLALYDYTGSVARMVFDSSDSYIYGNAIVFSNNAGTLRWLINSSGDLIPAGTGTLNIGSAAAYVGDVSYKTLTDRGCLAFVADWEMPDGSRKSNLEVLRSLRPHGSEKTIYGETKLDYSWVPKHSHKPAPKAEEDMVTITDGRVKHVKKGEKLGEDGVEMTSFLSMLFGAVIELDRRLAQPGGK
jgi:hypothetical protein